MLRKGRCSRQDLLNECNRVVRLVPLASDLKQIQEESRAILDKISAELVEE